MEFNIFTVLYKHHLCLVPNHVHNLPKGGLWSNHSLFSAPLQSLATTYLLSVSKDLPNSGHFISMESYNTWPFVAAFFHSASCFQVHPCCCMHQCFILFYGWIIFHCVDRPHLVYPSIHWWAYGWFPPFDYCESCFYEHLCTSTCLKTCFQFFWVYI